MTETFGAWSPESSGSDMGDSMIEPMYEDDIETMISEVRPEDVQHFDNKQFVRITDEQMPEILKFIDESDQFQFDDWAIIGETKGEEEEYIPGSSERPPVVDPSAAAAAAARKVFSASSETSTSHQLEAAEEEEEAKAEEEEEEEDGDEEEVQEEPNENENSMVFSMFLYNWEDQVRQIREVKRLEWEKRMKELLGNEEEEQQQLQKKPHEKEFVDDDGDSWVLLDNDDPAAKLSPQMAALDIDAAADTRSTDLQVAVVDATTTTQVARRTGFFESWPSFEVGSKLGVVLAATGTSFAFGFMMGARAAMNSFYRLCERPLMAGVVGVTTAFAVSLQPTMLMTAVKYIILGGVVGGTAVATPVFVVGTTGVFVSAAVYHAWIAAKRSVVRAVGSSSSPVRSPSVNRAIAVPLKMIAQSRPALLLDAGALTAKKNA